MTKKNNTKKNPPLELGETRILTSVSLPRGAGWFEERKWYTGLTTVYHCKNGERKLPIGCFKKGGEIRRAAINFSKKLWEAADNS